LIENNILKILSLWLEPNSKKSLPNINIRSCVYDVLLDIPVKGVTKVQKSGLSKEDENAEFIGLDIKELQERLSNFF
jgi:hypothetical protein